MLQKVKAFAAREIPSKWALVFIAIILVLFLLFNFGSYLTIPEWLLPNLFYAFMTAIFGFTFWIAGLFIRDSFDIGKMKKLRKLETLEALKTEYSRCKWSVEDSIENVDKNKRTTYFGECLNEISEMRDLRISKELQKEIEGYNKELRFYNLFRKASDSFIRKTIEHKSKNMFKKTLLKNGEWNAMLFADFFMAKYFNGEDVTCNWLSENDPLVLRNITKEIEESERHELDIMFKEINDVFQKEETLVTFREQKATIKDHGKKITENLQKEIFSIDQQLKKYDYLKVEEPQEDSPMFFQ